MKKKSDKDKDAKPKIDYLDLINRNLHDFKTVSDYSGYQFTRLDLMVRAPSCRANPSMSSLPSSRSSSTSSTSISPTTQSQMSPIVLPR